MPEVSLPRPEVRGSYEGEREGLLMKKLLILGGKN